jgi:DNA primase
MFPSNAGFNINDHLDKLTPAKERGKYICPACNGHNLSVNKMGKYNCWNCGDTQKIKDILTANSQDEPAPKAPRQKKTTYYEYPDRQGNPLIRVVRIDDGQGKKTIYQQHWSGQKWVTGYGSVKTEDIPLYRYAEVMNAIANGQQIILAEGESTVDAFWDKGIPATTTIGGTGKTVIKRREGLTCWVERNDSAFETIKPALADLAEASVILAPDCDQPGCLHMEMLGEVLNVSGWLYALPDSFQWSRLPDKEGLDFVDWIHDYPNLTTEEIFSAIQYSPKHQLKGTEVSGLPNQKSLLNSLFSENEYSQAVIKLLGVSLSESQLDLEIQAIAQKFNRSDSQVWRLYHKFSSESEKTENLADIANELNSLLLSCKATMKLEDYLPGDLIKIKEIYQRLCLRPEIGLMQFFSTCSGLLPVGTKISLCDYTDFDQPMGIYFTVCAEPSQRKTPGQQMIATKPLRILQQETDEQYSKAMREYKLELAEWEKNGRKDELPPIEPTRRIFFINSATQAGLRNLLQKQQRHGLVMIYDEFAADFRNRSKKYNAGLTEDLLSYYDGIGKREALADGFSGDFDETLISLQGSIQPGVIEEFLNGDNDPNGYWARLSIINQPNQALEIPTDPSQRGPKIDLAPLLVSHYKKVANLPKLHLKLTKIAESLMIEIMNRCDRKRVAASTQSMAAQWGKLPGKIGRFAALIHITEQIYSNGKVEDLDVGSKTLLKAANLAYFLLSETTNLYADNSQDNLASHLKKILEVSERVKEPLSAGKIKNLIWPFKKAKTSLDTIRSYFEDLVKLGYGKIVGSGVGRKFQLLFEGKVEKVEESGERSSFLYPPNILSSMGSSSKVENIEEIEEVLHSEVNSTSTDNITVASTEPETKASGGEDSENPLLSLPNASNPNEIKHSEGIESSTLSSTSTPKSSTSLPKSSTLESQQETRTVDGEITSTESSTSPPDSSTLESQQETRTVDGVLSSPQSSRRTPNHPSSAVEPETTTEVALGSSLSVSNSSTAGSNSATSPESSVREVEATSRDGEASSQPSTESSSSTQAEQRSIQVGDRVGFKNVWRQIETGVVLHITETDQIVTLRLDDGRQKMIYLEEAFLL